MSVENNGGGEINTSICQRAFAPIFILFRKWNLNNFFCKVEIAEPLKSSKDKPISIFKSINERWKKKVKASFYSNGFIWPFNSAQKPFFRQKMGNGPNLVVSRDFFHIVQDWIFWSQFPPFSNSFDKKSRKKHFTGWEEIMLRKYPDVNVVTWCA